jgi:hypothetical protein
VPGGRPDAGEFFDHYQSAALTRWATACINTSESLDPLLWPFLFLFYLFGCRLGLSEKLQIQIPLGGMVVDAIPANPDKTLRHHMEAKAPEELYPFHGHQLMPCTVTIVLGLEGDMGVCDTHNPVVANGNPVCVLAQVAHHMFGLGHRSLTVHHPACVFSTLQLLVETTQLVHFLKLPSDAVKELTFECTAELMDRVQEVFVLANVLPLSINGISGSRNDAMDMWVQR